MHLGLCSPSRRNSWVSWNRGARGLLLVEGNPLENINLIADPAKNFKIIMKDGTIYKNILTK